MEPDCAFGPDWGHNRLCSEIPPLTPSLPLITSRRCQLRVKCLHRQQRERRRWKKRRRKRRRRWRITLVTLFLLIFLWCSFQECDLQWPLVKVICFQKMPAGIFLLLMLLLLQSRPRDLACKIFTAENSIFDRSRTSGSSVWQRANNWGLNFTGVVSTIFITSECEDKGRAAPLRRILANKRLGCR